MPHKNNTGLEGRIGANPTGSRPLIPKWLLYGSIGTAAIGILAAGYFGLRGAWMPLPPQPRQAEQRQEQQYKQPQNSSEAKQQIPGIENVLTQEQIVEYAIGLRLRDKQLITPEMLQKLSAVNESLYFHFSSKTFQQSKFKTMLLTEQEYKALEGKLGGTIPDSAGTIGYQRDGSIHLYAISEVGRMARPFDILRRLAHETGNAEAGRLSPTNFQLGITNVKKSLAEVSEKYGLGDISDLYIGGIRQESLQILYGAAVFHYLEEAGVIAHPKLTDGGKAIDETVDAIARSKYFTSQAYLVAWYKALNRQDTHKSLLQDGKITSQQALSLFYQSLQRDQTREGLDQTDVEIVTAVRTAQDYVQQIKEAAKLSQRTTDLVIFP